MSFPEIWVTNYISATWKLCEYVGLKVNAFLKGGRPYSNQGF